ncbi:MacS family sensor histidine kinase [Nocardioides sp. Bht2]|uniref:MacS family sensor histidine kinase n=1 Tax=Nocardioides sp. Bht2 TaxID=3392297 RepID=UPI0039B6253F
MQPRRLDPAVEAVEDRLYRALALLRVVLTGNMVALNVFRYDNFSRPHLGMTVVAAMVLWTGVTIWAYGGARRRTPLLLGVDMAIAIAALLSTLVVKGSWFNASVPGFWIAGALMAWAIYWRWWGGLLAGAALSAVDLAMRDSISQTNYANVFLLVIGGTVVGYLAGSLQQMAASRAVAERAAASAAERARLARAVHDGVLQVLALVQRRGRELGGEAAELGELAGAQEAALRSLIRQQDVTSAPGDDAVQDLVVLVEQLTRRGSPRISVAGPGHQVLVPEPTARELIAVVEECLANVVRHVGPHAPVWIFVEELGDQIALSVRDDGPGIEPGRLANAAEQGRLGVLESIQGRIRDLGGTANLTTAPGQGVEWEFQVPRPQEGR